MIPEGSIDASTPDPNPTTAYAALFPGLDFSEREWLVILNSMTEQPSNERRRLNSDLVRRQQAELWMNAQDQEKICGVSGFGSRLRQFPEPFRIAVLEALEQLYNRIPGIDDALELDPPMNLEDYLREIGVMVPTSAHERLAALAFRAKHADWTPGSEV